MGKKFLIDTNSLIDAQMNKLPVNGIHFLSETINEDFTISFITYIEFLGFKDITKASEELISLANVIEINKAIIDTCITLRKSQKIKLPDAIIASTALVYNLTLITRNTSNFKNINDLQIIDPYKV